MKKLLLLLLVFAFEFSNAQQIVTGKVKSPDGKPVKDVIICIKGTEFKTFTTDSGTYAISVPVNYNTLTFQHSNYLVKEVEVKSNVVNIVLDFEADIFDLSLEELMELEVVSVSKKSEKISDAPQNVIVITSDEIYKRGYTDLEQIIHDLPGFDISRGYGTEYSQIYQRGYRSNNTDRTLFMIDGVEENDLWSGSAWIGRQFPLAQIERIEVIYGPSTTVYGANAFLGVINVITKDDDFYFNNEKNFGLNLETSYGTWNTKYADLSVAGRYKDISLTLSGRYYLSDEMDLSEYDDWDYDLSGYDLDYYKNILGTTNDNIAQIAMDMDNEIYYNGDGLNGIKPQYSNNTDNYYVYGKLKISNFTLGFETFRRRNGYGGWYRDDYELGPANGGIWTPKNSYIYAKYDKKITDKLSITSFSNFKQHGIDGESKEYYYTGYLNGEIGLSGLADSLGNLLPVEQRQIPYWWIAYYSTYSVQLRNELRINYDFSEKISLFVGSEYRHSHIQGDYIYSYEKNPEETALPVNTLGGNHYYSNDIGVYSQITYKPKTNLSFVLGGRFDYNKIRKTGGYGDVFNPKAAIVFTPSNLVFKLIYSEAFKDAGYWTKYGTTPGRLLNNPSLPPEKVRNFDAYIGYKPASFLYIDISGFYALYDGVVGTANVTYIDEQGNTVTTTQHQALGSMRIFGGQSTVNFVLKNYNAYFNYTYTNPYNTTEADEIRIGDIADHQINAGITASYFDKLDINLRANWVGEKPTGENTTISGNPYDFIDAYFVLNGAVTYNIWKGISIQASVFNILDKEYYHPGVRSANGTYYASRIPQYRRNIYGKLIIRY